MFHFEENIYSEKLKFANKLLVDNNPQYKDRLKDALTYLKPFLMDELFISVYNDCLLNIEKLDTVNMQSKENLVLLKEINIDIESLKPL